MAKLSTRRYFRCSKCGAVFDKRATLSAWESSSSLYGGAAVNVYGSRTCGCGNVMQVADIYRGAHDSTALRKLLHLFWVRLRGK